MNQHLVRRQRFGAAGDAVVIIQRHKAELIHLAEAADAVGAVGRGMQVNRAVFQRAVARDGAIEQLPLGEKAGVGNHLVHAGIGGAGVFITELFKRIHQQIDIYIARIAGAQQAFRAKVQAGGGGNGDQHHRGQDADGGQARAVALHAVGHGGDGYEVARLIIEALVLLQQAAQHNGARDEQQIGGDDDHDDGHKEPCQRLQRLLNGYRQIIGGRQQRCAEHAQRIVGARGLFARAFAAH